MSASIKPNSVTPNLSWMHQTVSISSPHSFIYPNPVASTTAPQFPAFHHLHKQQQHHQQLPVGAVDPLRLPTSMLSDPLHMLSRPVTTSTVTSSVAVAAVPSASNNVTAQDRTVVKAPVHTIHHTQLKRGREMGQVL